MTKAVPPVKQTWQHSEDEKDLLFLVSLYRKEETFSQVSQWTDFQISLSRTGPQIIPKPISGGRMSCYNYLGVEVLKVWFMDPWGPQNPSKGSLEGQNYFHHSTNMLHAFFFTAMIFVLMVHRQCG